MKLLALVTNTLRELKAKATLVVLASISTVIIVGTLAAFSVTETAEGMTLVVFGNPAGNPVTPEQLSDIVMKMQAGLAAGLFSGVVLFGVFATAGTIPDMLERGAVDIYLSKPIARWELLLGKYLGAVTAITLNIVYFVGAMWLVFGLKLGVWNHQFLLSALTLSFLFACLHTIVAYLGVLSRNVAIAIIGAFLYLVVIGSVLQKRESGLYMLSENDIYRRIIDGLYYLLPQLSAVHENIMRQITHQPMEWKPFAQSLATSTLMFLGAAAVFRKKDF